MESVCPLEGRTVSVSLWLSSACLSTGGTEKHRTVGVSIYFGQDLCLLVLFQEDKLIKRISVFR